MLYVAVFCLFVSCVVLLVKIYESVGFVDNSISVIISNLEKLSTDNSELLKDIRTDIDTNCLILREIEKKVML